MSAALSAALLLSGPIIGPVQGSGVALLERVVTQAQSPGAIRFSGTRLVTVRERGKTVSHSETIIRDGRRSRVDFAPGSRFEGQTIIETPGGRRHVLPDRREIRVVPRRLDAADRRLARLLTRVRAGEVRLDVASGGRIAGVEVNRLTLRSSGGEPLVELFVEPRQAIVLKRTAFGRGGELLGSFVFTRFETPAKISSGTFAVDRRGYRIVRPIDELRRLSTKAGFSVATLPSSSGYQLEGARERNYPGGTIIISFYSSERQTLSLFMTRGALPKGPGREKNGKRGERADVSSLRWTRGEYGYGLVGEESAARLRELANSLVVSP